MNGTKASTNVSFAERNDHGGEDVNHQEHADQERQVAMQQAIRTGFGEVGQLPAARQSELHHGQKAEA